VAHSRAIAARIIHDVMHGKSLADTLPHALKSIADARDRGFIQALCYGVCRFYSRLNQVLNQLLTNPLQTTETEVRALLLVGLYQLMEMQLAPHAAVAETVNAAVILKKSWAKGLVNAVLREYLRQKETIQFDEYAHPTWWVKAIKKAWPNDFEKILLANNAHPPFALRVNQQHLSREKYMELFAKDEVRIIPETTNGVIMTSPVAAESLPGFEAGDVSVQDGAAQLAAELLDLSPQLRVLDACAAPGGKFAHIIEIEPQLTACIAIEKDKERLFLIEENMTRLQHQNKSIQLIAADANDIKNWWDGELFDRILLDAPCSASGVIRRHPDIKLLRYAEDITALAKQQLQLLNSLWPLLTPNGLLLYATCSIFPAENVDVLQRFFATHDYAREEKIVADWGRACDIGRQILPGEHEMDGFYYAKVRKCDGMEKL